LVDTALAGVVLAAGESRRMGTPKQLLPFGERTILERVVDTLLTAGVGQVIVVLGHLADRVRTVLGDRACSPR
jgi:molybdenum cofactor cytidylyltransferase